MPPDIINTVAEVLAWDVFLMGSFFLGLFIVGFFIALVDTDTIVHHLRTIIAGRFVPELGWRQSIRAIAVLIVVLVLVYYAGVLRP